jgi:hypothetical protein
MPTDLKKRVKKLPFKRGNYMALRRQIGNAMIKLCKSARAKQVHPLVFAETLLSALIEVMRSQFQRCQSEKTLRDALVMITNAALIEHKILHRNTCKPKKPRKHQ